MNQELQKREMIDFTRLPKLPHGWKWVVPADVCLSIASGSTPTADKMFSGQGEVPFLKVYNLTFDGLLDFTNKPTFIARATHEGMLKRSQVFSGDVLINIVGPPLGKVSIVPDQIQEANINQAIVVFRMGPQIISKYLAYALMTKSVLERITSKAKATAGQFNIGVGMCRSLLPIPLAPIEEQRRIVAEIENQFTRLDAGVAALRRTQANLKRYRAAVLKTACEGSLVPTEAELARADGRSYESGERLLARILSERRQNWEGRGQYKEPDAPKTADLPMLPDGWTWATAQQLNLANRPCAYGVLQPGEDVPEGVPLVRVGDINNGKVELANMKRISTTIAAHYPRTKLHGGELAITLVGAIGRTAIIPDSLAGGNTARAVGIIPLTKKANAHWIEIWFRNPTKNAEMDSKSHEVARKTLNLEDVRIASVALPPLAEQMRIVAEVERRLSVLDELESVVSANLLRATRLRQSILQRAFNGIEHANGGPKK